MIDYTQQAFATPPDIFDPSPSVADYLDDYEMRNQAWMDTWASRQPDGGYGPRESSFERRSPYIPTPETAGVPVESLPPILRNLYGEEDGRTAPGDMPVGALVGDPRDKTDAELTGEYDALTGAGAMYAASGPGVAAGLFAPGISTAMTAMARSGMRNQIGRDAMEILTRSLPHFENQGMFSQTGPPGVAPDVGTFLTPGGTQVFTLPDLFPSEPGGPESGGPSGPGQDTYQGGEVGAGGWAGGGGL